MYFVNNRTALILQIEALKENWAETKVTEYSEGYSNGYHKACNDMIKILNIEEKCSHPIGRGKEK